MRYGDTIRNAAIPTVHTDQLTLRAIQPGDLDDYAAMWADPQYMEYLGGPVTDRAAVWRNMALSLGHWDLWGYGLWSVIETDSGQLVGRAGLWNEPGWPGVEAAWFIAPGWWGRGYAPEAARASVTFAFTHLPGLDRVVSVIDPGNAKSIRVAEKIGETLSHTEHLHGKEQQVWAVTRQAWEARPAP